MLKRLGHNVRILEQNPASTRSSLAAGMGTGPNGAHFFSQHSSIKPGSFSLQSSGFQYLDHSAHVKSLVPAPMGLTTWTTLYYNLRALFDGFPSSYCPRPDQTGAHDGRTCFEVNKRVICVDFTGEVMNVQFEDVDASNKATHTHGHIEADLVLDASGAFSTIRNDFLSELQQSYAGYVAWRGTVPEIAVSENTRQLFDERFNISAMTKSYIVGYVSRTRSKKSL